MRRLSIKIKMEVFAPTHWWTPHVLKKDAAKSALLDAPIDKTWYSCYLRMEAILIRFLWQGPSSEEDFLLLEVRQPAAFTSRWGQMFFLGWREAVRLWNLHESKKNENRKTLMAVLQEPMTQVCPEFPSSLISSWRPLSATVNTLSGPAASIMAGSRPSNQHRVGIGATATPLASEVCIQRKSLSS